MALMMPIDRTLAALPYTRITVCSGHIVGKAAFVDIDDWTAAALEGLLKLTVLPLIALIVDTPIRVNRT